MLDINDFQFASTKKLIRDTVATAIKPEPKLNISDWADANRMMTSATSPDEGPWRTSRTEYLCEIMDCLSPHERTQQITFIKGSQVGASECINNFIGAVIDIYHGSCMMVLPTLDLAKKVSRTRLQPMIDATPSLRGKVRDQNAREAGNSTFLKEFEGGHLILATSNSATALRSHPIKFLCLDEIDAFEADISDEGDPMELAKARTVNFGRKKKIFQVSTPTVRGFSRIETEFNRSSQEYYQIPCPFCGNKFVISWKYIKWNKDDNGKHLPETVYLECPSCKNKIEERYKTWMLSKENGAEWVATAVGEPNHRGFHLSSLYSPLGWNSWADIVKRWLRASERSKVGDQAEMKVFVNTILGETFVEQENTLNYIDLWKEREDYPIAIDVPLGGLFLTVGADVQKDRIEASVYAWGEQEECWAVEHNIFWGDPTDRNNQVWKKLDELIYQKKFKHESGNPLSVSIACVDSGAFSDEIYHYVVEHKQRGVYAVKGIGEEGKPIVKPSKNVTYGRNKIPVRLFLIGTFEAKRMITLRLAANKTNKTIHYPIAEDYDEDFFKQLTSERMITKYVNGYPRRNFILGAGTRNEALDCFVYALAAKRISDPSIANIKIQLGIKDKVDPVIVDDVPVEKPTHMESIQKIRRNNQFGRKHKSWISDW